MQKTKKNQIINETEQQLQEHVFCTLQNTEEMIGF